MNRESYIWLEEFRKARLEKIKNNKAPVPLYDRGKVIVHLIPEQTLKEPWKEFDILKLKRDVAAFPLFGEKMRAGSLSFNFDGALCRSMASDNPVFSYVEFFRNGAIEAVEDFYLNSKDKDFPIYDYEEELIIKTGHYLEQLGNIGATPPVFFLLSILDAVGYSVGENPFIENEMLFPPTIFAGADANPATLLRSVLDQLWQAAGNSKCPNYDSKGEYRAR